MKKLVEKEEDETPNTCLKFILIFTILLILAQNRKEESLRVIL